MIFLAGFIIFIIACNCSHQMVARHNAADKIVMALIELYDRALVYVPEKQNVIQVSPECFRSSFRFV